MHYVKVILVVFFVYFFAGFVRSDDIYEVSETLISGEVSKDKKLVNYLQELLEKFKNPGGQNTNFRAFKRTKGNMPIPETNPMFAEDGSTDNKIKEDLETWLQNTKIYFPQSLDDNNKGEA